MVMKFIDVATVEVRAGDGGDGRTSFRHEKFVDRGGPDGGNGGNGGNVVFIASRNQNTLMAFRFQKELAAQPGGNGDKSKRHGRRGKDLVVEVPVGTVVYDGDTVLCDLVTDSQTAIIAKGGRGGFGNAHFISSVRQAPKFAEPGGKGQQRSLRLELKLIADVGLVGLPNAGKSTFLSVVSNAKPEIADYPFTTLTPNLGVVDVKDAGSMLVADIPGLIEGAAMGKGLGDEFLRHVERTAVLLHLVDCTSQDVAADYTVIQKELSEYKIDLTQKRQVVALSKTDLVPEKDLKKSITALKKVLPKDEDVRLISAQTHSGTKEVLYRLLELVQQYRREEQAKEPEPGTNQGLPVLRLADEKPWTIERPGKELFYITGDRVDKFAARTDFSNEESIQRYRAILKKMGVVHGLLRQGIEPGHQVKTSYGQFEW